MASSIIDLPLLQRNGMSVKHRLLAPVLYTTYYCFKDECCNFVRIRHYDIIRTSRAYGARSPRSHYDVILITTSRPYGDRSPRYHYDVILIVMSFATELAMPTVTDVRYGILGLSLIHI